MSDSAAPHRGSRVTNLGWPRFSSVYVTDRDRSDAARLRPLRRKRRREKLRANAVIILGSGAVLLFTAYVTTSR